METATSAQLFKDVAFVAYPVKNVKAARAFYEGTLGLAVTANWQDQWVEYDIGAGTLALVVADETHKPGLHGPSVGIEVTDFDRVLEYLKERSVPVHSGPFDSPVCRGCIIRDPDGNELLLHAKKS
jgi:predicted enzyme related to lactoylglutathione lyase